MLVPLEKPTRDVRFAMPGENESAVKRAFEYVRRVAGELDYCENDLRSVGGAPGYANTKQGKRVEQAWRIVQEAGRLVSKAENLLKDISQTVNTKGWN